MVVSETEPFFGNQEVDFAVVLTKFCYYESNVVSRVFK